LGFAANQTSEGTFDLDPGGVDPVLKIHGARPRISHGCPDYPKRHTVPAIVDVPYGAVVPTTPAADVGSVDEGDGLPP